MSTSAGTSATYPPSAMFISGPMASIWKPVSKSGAMHSRHHRRHARGQEGARGLYRRPAREFGIVARSAAGSAAPRFDRRARVGGRRRRTRLLESTWRSLAGGARAAMLGAQDREHPQQAAQEPSLKSQAGVAGDLDVRDESRCPNRVWRLHRELRTEIRKSRRLPEQRSRGAAGVL